MGKRKHKDKKSHTQRKRREKRARYYSESESGSSSTQDEHYEDRRRRYYDPDPEFSHEYNKSHGTETDYDLPISGSEASIEGVNCDNNLAGVSTNEVAQPKSTGATGEITLASEYSAPTVKDSMPGKSTDVTPLPADILEALGDPKGKEEVFGPKISEEIATRWGRVLVDGLTKEQKQEFIEKSLVPDNFRLVKAPLLNPELIPVLSESARARDKLLEKAQNQLGMGISRLTFLASAVIDGNTDKIEILKQISEISQIILDSHYEDTKRRRKLVTSNLDKRFLSMISDVKRDTYLLGANLGEKIKASKSAERSGLQVKRSDATATSARKNPHQGNWRGPPRSTVHHPYRQGGQRGRYIPQSNRRAPPQAPDRHPRAPAKQSGKNFKPQ